MAKPMIQTKGMEITYNRGKSNEFKALKGVDVEIAPREYIILFGPSGCGKSTLMYSIFGVLPLSAGEMFVKGESIYKYKPQDLVAYQRRTVGIIYQQFNLITSINVLDNVALPLIFVGVPPKERNERARMLLKRFGIETVEKKLPTNLSGGQQQRVAVARSLVNDPEILLADEPVGNLDSISSEQVMGKLDEINSKDRKTVMLVTHDAKFLPYAHRVFYLKDGTIRRIVTNPEKKQVRRVKPGETIVTEIEQLARMYPYAEPLELKVKSAVNFIAEDLDFEQISRIEKAVLRMIDGRMDEFMFFEYLILPRERGGAGILSGAAERMAKKAASLIVHSEDIRRFRDEMKRDSMFIHQQKFVERLLEYFVTECGFEIAPGKLPVVKEAVVDRISGFIARDDFEEKLSLPAELGGAGYKMHVAHGMTRYLEKLIAQGGYIIEKKE